MSAFLNRTVTLVARQKTGTDTYGNDVYGEVQTSIDGCAWNPRTSTEDAVDARQQVVSGLILWAPAGTPVTAADAVIIEGRRYEVDGDAGPWTGSLSSLDHVEVALRRVTG